VTAIVFWLSVSVCFYTYCGYPILLLLLRAVINRKISKLDIEPFVSLVIPAYNEARCIERKIRNTRELDYPPDSLEIIVASDGSNDATAELAGALADGDRVHLFAYPENRGKIAVLNDTVPRCRGEVIVFSDAAALLPSDALRKLIRNFADPQVGAVSGKYMVIRPDEAATGQSEDFYWRYETFLKVQESELSSTLGAHGHLHAIRKHLYPFPAPGTINDDYIIPVSVLAKGYRAVYEPEALVYEEAMEMTGFGRRIRIMAGNVQQIREIKGLLWPFQPLPILFFLSHKVARLAVPFAMLAALIANLFLLGSPFYRIALAVQALFYLLALAGTRFSLRPRILLLPFYFSMVNVATFFGIYHALTSRRRMAWK
jgi:cellulose synthase/poly-beta-1,6-N-acetylglucosamine synthase-like glycosyltransferase